MNLEQERMPIAVAIDEEKGIRTIVIVCDDGSIWRSGISTTNWIRMPDIPQDKDSDIPF